MGEAVYVAKYSSEADVKIYVATNKSDADLVVYKAQYQSGADIKNGIWFFAEHHLKQRRKYTLPSTKAMLNWLSILQNIRATQVGRT
jgi:hypothetical protein